MTPSETFRAIEAAIWRDDREQKRELKLAWSIAMLTRAKNVPKLSLLLASLKPAKPLTGKQLLERRKEYQEMTSVLDINAINEMMKKKKKQ